MSATVIPFKRQQESADEAAEREAVKDARKVLGKVYEMGVAEGLRQAAEAR